MGVKYSDLKIQKSIELKEIEISGQKVFVKKYLEVDKKSSIVSLAVMGAVIEGCVHDILMDAYFHVMLVENYTDIEFEKNGIEDILQTFDELESSDVLAIIVDAIGSEEYASLYSALEILKNNVNEYNKSQAGAVKALADLNTQLNQTE